MLILIIIGVLLLIAGILSIPPLSRALDMPKFGNWVRSGAFIVIGVVAIFLKSLFFWADASHQYILLKPGGQIDAMVDVQGIKFKGFAKVQAWAKFLDVRTPKGGEDLADVEGILTPVNVRFIDQVIGDVFLTARFQLPNDKENFINLYKEFKSVENLTNNTLLPTVREVVSNTGYMFAAQDYISGAASDFRITIKEQLEGGSYSVEKREYRDTIITSIEQDDRGIKEIQTRYEVIKRKNQDGSFIRIPNDINENRIIVSQVIVDDVNLEETFRKRLEAQRDESAKRQLEQQKIKTAKDAQARIVAEGERDKAAERVTQEKEQVKALISIETKLKQEETNKKLAQIQLETERLQSQKRKVAAEAKKYELQQADGLSEEQKFLVLEATKQVTALSKAIENAKWPTNYTTLGSGGSSGKGGDPLNAMIQIMTANLANAQQTMKKAGN